MIEFETFNLIEVDGVLPFEPFTCPCRNCNGDLRLPDNSMPRFMPHNVLKNCNVPMIRMNMGELTEPDEGKIASMLVICDTCNCPYEYMVGIGIPKEN